MALPKIGLTAVIENLPGFKKALDTINKAMDDAQKKTKSVENATTPLSKSLDKAGFSLDSLKDKFSSMTGVSAKTLDVIFDITKAFGPMALAAGAAVVAVLALGAGFLALGNRGAPLVGLADSFDRLTASVGVSSKTLLVDLREASAGTVSDFDLIRRANMALVGAQGEFGREFGQKLPKLLEAARAAARATGQDVDFLFQSLVTGIKRSSPLLIDNTGIVLKVGAANEALAEKLGKSVEALTAEEKQIAVLNATVEAGERLIDSMGGSLETNSEKMARSNAIITNSLDALAIAVQPAFGTVLDLVNRVLGGFQQLVTAAAPILGAIASIVVDLVVTPIQNILTFLSPIFNTFTNLMTYAAIAWQAVAGIVHKAAEISRSVVEGLVGFFQNVAKNLFGLDINNLGKNLFEGAAAAFGSFANGILTVANQLIFPAIIGIAKFIADFLIGFSPPKKGPLSEIDKGGENIMLAWLNGLTGVSLEPVEAVAAQVNAMLGDIGKASLPAVDARLRQLDMALLPFQNRLDIVKSQFEAIAAPAQAALDAIDRQMQQAQTALLNGDARAADVVRRLDVAREAIEQQLSAQQALVDQQQIQFGLAQASQAQERALLNIRKAQLTVTSKAATVAKDTAAKIPKELKGAGGAADPVATPPSAGGIGLPSESALDLIGGQSAVNDAIAGIQDAFAGQLDTSQLGLFAENAGALQEQFGRIGSVDLGAKLGDKFKGLTDLFNPSVENSPANLVSKFFGDASVPGSFASFVTALPDKLSTIAYDVGVRLGENLRAAFIFLTGSESDEGSLKSILAVVTGDSSVEGSVANFFSLLPDRAAAAASELWTKLDESVFAPVRNFLTGSGEGTLQGMLDDAVFFFEQLPSQILFALAGFAELVYGALATPVISAINSLIGMVEGAIKGFLGGVADFIQGVVDGLGDVAPQFLRDAATGLRETANGVTFGRISTDIPNFAASIAGAATGGMFTDGLLRVGERGPELIGSASRIGVLPAQITQALEGLGSILAQPQPMYVPGGDTFNSNSSTFNFNGVSSDNDARRRYNALRAGMR